MTTSATETTGCKISESLYFPAKKQITKQKTRKQIKPQTSPKFIGEKKVKKKERSKKVKNNSTFTFKASVTVSVLLRLQSPSFEDCLADQVLFHLTGLDHMPCIYLSPLHRLVHPSFWVLESFKSTVLPHNCSVTFSAHMQGILE